LSGFAADLTLKYDSTLERGSAGDRTDSGNHKLTDDSTIQFVSRQPPITID
jgi:hypothetical protein